MKISFLIADNLYSTTQHFAGGLSNALRKAGAHVSSHRLVEGNTRDVLAKVFEERPTFTCSFSDLTVGGEPLGAQWEIPHLSLLVDPAIYFLHHTKSPFSWMTCVDRGDLKLLGDFPRTFFFPHAVEKVEPPFEEHSYDVIFLGSCEDSAARAGAWPSRYGKNVAAQLEECAQKVLSPGGPSCAEALFPHDLLHLHHELDLYTRSLDRASLINALRSFDVHVWGEGPWQRLCPHATCHPPVPFTEALSLIRQAKVTLNSSPRFKDGLHERVLHAYALNSLPFTSESLYLQEEFSPPTYSPGLWEETPDLLSDALQNRAAHLNEGRTHLLSHTWDVRASQLLAHLI